MVLDVVSQVKEGSHHYQNLNGHRMKKKCEYGNRRSRKRKRRLSGRHSQHSNVQVLWITYYMAYVRGDKDRTTIKKPALHWPSKMMHLHGNGPTNVCLMNKKCGRASWPRQVTVIKEDIKQNGTNCEFHPLTFELTVDRWPQRESHQMCAFWAGMQAVVNSRIITPC